MAELDRPTREWMRSSTRIGRTHRRGRAHTTMGIDLLLEAVEQALHDSGAREISRR